MNNYFNSSISIGIDTSILNQQLIFLLKADQSVIDSGLTNG